jgi:branched-chain amino acid transport system ATP-binding protein
MTAASHPALSVSGLTAGYGPLTVVWDVSLDVQPGEVVVVLGPNGAGKSSLLSAIFGAGDRSSGSVRVGEVDVSSLPYPKRRASGLGWVPEGRNPFTQLSVRDNLYVSAWLAGHRKKFDVAARDMCDRFPVLGDKFHQRAGTLSGGEQQILALARMLIQEPRVVMLDEPTVGLAPVIVDVLAATVTELKHSGVAWLVAEQNVDWLIPLTDVVHLMRGGRILRTGGPELVATREGLRSAYLGDVTAVNKEEM